MNWLQRLLLSGLNFFFHHLYHTCAWGYDGVAAIVSAGHWREWVLQIVPHLHGGRILELGFGTGHLQTHRLQNGQTIFGLDESAQMARLTRRRAARLALSYRLVRGYAQNIPFASAAFDCVAATFPAPYILEAHTLQEIHRVLRPNGQLVILFGAAPIGPRIWERFSAWLFRATSQAAAAADQSSRLLQPLQAAGFEVQWLEKHTPSATLMFVLAIKSAVVVK